MSAVIGSAQDATLVDSLPTELLAKVFKLSCAVFEEFEQWCEEHFPPTKYIPSGAASPESDDDDDRVGQ